MSLLDDDLNMGSADSAVLEDVILKYIKNHTFLSPHVKWDVVVDDIADCMNNPEEYYLYHTINNLPNNIYIYSSMHIRQGNTFSVVNKRYKHVNLKHILDYESTR